MRSRHMILAGFVLALAGFIAVVQADDIGEQELIPSQINDDTFAALKSASPFRRTVGLSGSVVLTGLARIDNELVATLYDTKLTEFYLVSKEANNRGWQLVEVRGNEGDLSTLTAKIQIGGGEVIPIRYEKLPPAARKSKSTTRVTSRPGNDSSGSRDGSRRSSSEFSKKLSRLTAQQRESISQQMSGLRDQGLSREERLKIFTEKVDEALSQQQ